MQEIENLTPTLTRFNFANCDITSYIGLVPIIWAIDKDLFTTLANTFH